MLQEHLVCSSGPISTDAPTMHEIRVQYRVERQLFERRVSLQGRDLPIA
jgi:hypothetical protein